MFISIAAPVKLHSSKYENTSTVHFEGKLESMWLLFFSINLELLGMNSFAENTIGERCNCPNEIAVF
jgi:hypothetical protein